MNFFFRVTFILISLSFIPCKGSNQFTEEDIKRGVSLRLSDVRTMAHALYPAILNLSGIETTSNPNILTTSIQNIQTVLGQTTANQNIPAIQWIWEQLMNLDKRTVQITNPSGSSPTYALVSPPFVASDGTPLTNLVSIIENLYQNEIGFDPNQDEPGDVQGAIAALRTLVGESVPNHPLWDQTNAILGMVDNSAVQPGTILSVKSSLSLASPLTITNASTGGTATVSSSDIIAIQVSAFPQNYYFYQAKGPVSSGELVRFTSTVPGTIPGLLLSGGGLEDIKRSHSLARGLEGTPLILYGSTTNALTNDILDALLAPTFTAQLSHMAGGESTPNIVLDSQTASQLDLTFGEEQFTYTYSSAPARGSSIHFAGTSSGSLSSVSLYLGETYSRATNGNSAASLISYLTSTPLKIRREAFINSSGNIQYGSSSNPTVCYYAGGTSANSTYISPTYANLRSSFFWFGKGPHRTATILTTGNTIINSSSVGNTQATVSVTDMISSLNLGAKRVISPFVADTTGISSPSLSITLSGVTYTYPIMPSSDNFLQLYGINTTSGNTPSQMLFTAPTQTQFFYPYFYVMLDNDTAGTPIEMANCLATQLNLDLGLTPLSFTLNAGSSLNTIIGGVPYTYTLPTFPLTTLSTTLLFSPVFSSSSAPNANNFYLLSPFKTIDTESQLLFYLSRIYGMMLQAVTAGNSVAMNIFYAAEGGVNEVEYTFSPPSNATTAQSDAILFNQNYGPSPSQSFIIPYTPPAASTAVVTSTGSSPLLSTQLANGLAAQFQGSLGNIPNSLENNLAYISAQIRSQDLETLASEEDPQNDILGHIREIQWLLDVQRIPTGVFSETASRKLTTAPSVYRALTAFLDLFQQSSLSSNQGSSAASPPNNTITLTLTLGTVSPSTLQDWFSLITSAVPSFVSDAPPPPPSGGGGHHHHRKC